MATIVTTEKRTMAKYAAGCSARNGSAAVFQSQAKGPRPVVVLPKLRQQLEPNLHACAHLRCAHQYLRKNHAIHVREDASLLDTPRGAVPSGVHQLCRARHPAQQQKRSRQHTTSACLSRGWGHTPRKSPASRRRRQRGQRARASSHMNL